MKKISKRKINQICDIMLWSLFLTAGILVFLWGVLPRTIEIDPTGVEITAQLHKRSVFPPFKKEVVFVSNVKQAVITKATRRKRIPFFAVELETFNGEKTPITINFWGFLLKQRLENQINNSIQNRTNFKKTFIDIYLLICGILLILISTLCILLGIDDIKRDKERNRRRREKYKEKKALERSLKGNIEPEQKEYNNINDSIIR